MGASTRTRWMAALAALTTPIAVGADASATATTAPAEAVALRMAMPYCDDPLITRTGSAYTPAVLEFLDQVDELSRGSLTIEIVWQLGGPEFCALADGEQQVVQGVIDGAAELAFVGTRVFDTFGVKSFGALHAPFLVDSYALQQAILDSEIPAALLADLEPIGLDGLGLLAGGLRKPIGREGPILNPDDFAGITFQIYRSDTQAAAVEALGATPTDVVGAGRDSGLIEGEIDGHEHSLNNYVVRANYILAPYATTNVNLWAETVALITNPEAMAALTAEQQAWLRQAAATAAERSVALVDNEADLLALACAGGAKAVAATDDDLAALRAAVEPVYEELRGDDETAALLDRIGELKGDTPAEAPPIPDGCAAGGESTAPTTAAATALEGLFHTEPVTIETAAAALAARGLPESVAEEFFAGHGETVVFTLLIQGGTYAHTESYDGRPASEGSRGTAEQVGDNALIVTPAGLAPIPIEYDFDGTTLLQRLAIDDAELQQAYVADPSIAGVVIIVESAPFIIE